MPQPSVDPLAPLPLRRVVVAWDYINRCPTISLQRDLFGKSAPATPDHTLAALLRFRFELGLERRKLGERRVRIRRLFAPFMPLLPFRVVRHGQAGGRVRAADGRAADLPHAGEDGANDAPAWTVRRQYSVRQTRQAQPPVSVRPIALPTKLSGRSLARSTQRQHPVAACPRVSPTICRPGDACPAGGAVLRAGPAAIPRSSPARLPPRQRRHYRPSQRSASSVTTAGAATGTSGAGSSAIVSPVTGASGGVGEVSLTPAAVSPAGDAVSGSGNSATGAASTEGNSSLPGAGAGVTATSASSPVTASTAGGGFGRRSRR